MVLFVDPILRGTQAVYVFPHIGIGQVITVAVLLVPLLLAVLARRP